MRTLVEWLALQESVHPKTIDMGLGRVTTVARSLGVDKPACPVITVGGTNGKGSTVAHLEALLESAGRRTGMFTSPHFIRYNERIRVGGIEVEDAELIAAFETIEQARGSTTLTFFEYNTLAALLIFQRRAVEVAILEVGLGGRLDATNLVDADVAIVCSIGFDHRDWLGDTLEQIGAEKAGIFRAGRPAVLSTPQMPHSVFARIGEIGARAVVAERDFSWSLAAPGRERSRWSYRGLRLSLQDLPPSALAGSIQYRNASAALAAIESLPPEPRGAAAAQLTERSVGEALARVRLAGRFQVVPGEVEWILDIAHNEPAARMFAQHVRERPQGEGATTLAVVGILGDKDAPAIVRELEPLVSHWVLCSLPGPRGVTAAALAQRVQLPRERVTLADSVEEACERARAAARPGDRILVFGSVHTVGPALRWLRIY
ncbi:MAG TPA: bifunctional tetrahydrofolate synthase/dihydrofolate synthase [Steroidobacteraceae bacterium]|nr:bifunctional tetrahydrofolate synthase/dihydrofolate synthase [Steroidobacteraceae bacterium]